MDASFPVNDVGLILGRDERHRRWPAANAAKSSWLVPGLPDDPADWDDADHECFLAALLEMEAEERKALGLLGRSPFWEIWNWAVRNPEAAERCAWAAILIAGIMAGLLWHVFVPLFD